MGREHVNAVVLFARDPVPGKVKTRLRPLLDEAATCRLYTHFLRDGIETMLQVEEADHYVGIYPSHQSGFLDRFRDPPSLTIFDQRGKDLGERMRNAFADRFEEGYTRVVIVGSDSPSLPVDFIRAALRSEKDLVLGPSTDGGYYLIGMVRRLVDVFDGVAWGSERVLNDTLERIRKTGAGLELLPVWYDVDRPEDLLFLKTHLDLIVCSDERRKGATWEFLNGLAL